MGGIDWGERQQRLFIDGWKGGDEVGGGGDREGYTAQHGKLLTFAMVISSEAKLVIIEFVAKLWHPIWQAEGTAVI